MVAAEVFTKFKNLIATSEPPSLGPEQRSGVTSEAELARQLEIFFAEEKISSNLQPLLKSAAFLWHDHLDASHTLSQHLETKDGSWLHGIMHRREPDYGNAKYWFHRVGKHPAFSTLAEIVGRENWDPFGFIDECEAAEQGRSVEAMARLRAMQAAEFDVLVQYIFQNT